MASANDGDGVVWREGLKSDKATKKNRNRGRVKNEKRSGRLLEEERVRECVMETEGG